MICISFSKKKVLPVYNTISWREKDCTKHRLYEPFQTCIASCLCFSGCSPCTPHSTLLAPASDCTNFRVFRFPIGKWFPLLLDDSSLFGYNKCPRVSSTDRTRATQTVGIPIGSTRPTGSKRPRKMPKRTGLWSKRQGSCPSTRTHCCRHGLDGKPPTISSVWETGWLRWKVALHRRK